MLVCSAHCLQMFFSFIYFSYCKAFIRETLMISPSILGRALEAKYLHVGMLYMAPRTQEYMIVRSNQVPLARQAEATSHDQLAKPRLFVTPLTSIVCCFCWDHIFAMGT
ncbi:hypothetical protein F4808DRAFT_409718 [Astrocystis sublimbata]|nr:hypothetical protein F4808DRAFT_409718 [Astrocystis sublimbata]